MSMENAILELAAAIRYHADKREDALRPLLTRAENSIEAIEREFKPAAVKPDAELEQAVQKVEAEAKTPNAETKAAIAEANQKVAQRGAQAEAKNDASGAAEPAGTPAGAQPGDDEATPDYAKDVKPKLVGLGKTNGRDAVIGLLGEFGAKNGEQIKPEDYRAVLARIEELTAA